jgi:hypothetical protein
MPISWFAASPPVNVSIRQHTSAYVSIRQLAGGAREIFKTIQSQPCPFLGWLRWRLQATRPIFQDASTMIHCDYRYEVCVCVLSCVRVTQRSAPGDAARSWPAAAPALS